MKQFTVFKHDDHYRLSYVNDKGEQVDYGELINESILPSVNMIARWISDLKSEEQIQLDELEQKHYQAFQYIVSNATDEEKLSLIDIFPHWEVNKDYQQNDEFQYEDNIYRVLQNHQSQAHWLPSESPSLYVNINNKVSIQDFVQPTGVHDAYMIGDEVIFEGYVWQSIIDNNVWSPSDYPQGWQKGTNA